MFNPAFFWLGAFAIATLIDNLAHWLIIDRLESRTMVTLEQLLKNQFLPFTIAQVLICLILIGVILHRHYHDKKDSLNVAALLGALSGVLAICLCALFRCTSISLTQAIWAPLFGAASASLIVWAQQRVFNASPPAKKRKKRRTKKP